MDSTRQPRANTPADGLDPAQSSLKYNLKPACIGNLNFPICAMG